MQIQILKSDHGRGEISTIRDFCFLTASIKSDNKITWSEDKGDVLAVDWHDLLHKESILWKDVNIVVSETYQQIIDALPKFDFTRSYIFVTESYTTPEVIAASFPNLHIIKTFTRFVEIFEYGQSIYNPVSQFAWAQDLAREPAHDFFCLIGRQSWLRSHLVNRLSTFDLSNSLVKYHGVQVDKSKAPDLDPISYDPNKFYFAGNTFNESPWLIPAKLIPTKLYEKFYFEVQHETDPYHSKGWQIAEFHVTEKTIKSLICGIPCLMFGAPGYNSWLLDSFGIDLSLEQFDMSFDTITNNMQRVDTMLMQLPNLIKNKVSLNTKDQHAKNMLGFTKLRDFNLQQLRELYKLLQSL